MATFRRKSGKWVCEICVKGKRRSKTFESKARAKSWALENEHELKALAEGVSKHHTFADVFRKYADEVAELKKGARWEIIRLEKFCTYEIAEIKLIDLRREHIEAWVSMRLKSVKPSSVNRELNLMSHCLTQARRWRLMNHNPMDDLKRPKDPPHRDRRISADESNKILLTLNFDEAYPVVQQQQRVAVAFLFAIETAMRAGEICSLTPADINEDDRTAFLRDTKNGLPRYVPLSARAIELLEKLKPYNDKIFNMQSGTISTVFRSAVLKAGIHNLTFHDTRHEAITRLAQKLDVLDLARAVGHRDIKQLTTYYNKSAKDLAKQL